MNNAEIIVLETVDSTNNYIKANPGIRGEFTAVRALSQTDGRGRFSRTWYMGPDLDLAFSFIFTPSAPASNIGIYSLVCGMALRRVMLPVIGVDLDLKWPNDLYCRGRKMAGILCEAIFEDRPRVIAGIGVNVNSRLFPEWLMGSATSVAIETGSEHDPAELMMRIISECKTMFSALEIPLDPGLVREWEASCSSIGKRAIYNQDGIRAEGTVRSIDGQGRLVVTDDATGSDISVMDEVIINER